MKKQQAKRCDAAECAVSGAFERLNVSSERHKASSAPHSRRTAIAPPAKVAPLRVAVDVDASEALQWVEARADAGVEGDGA